MSYISDFRGEGPGARSPDGSSVELYLRLPYRGELDLIGPSIIGDEVLELGCGVGRMTAPLLQRGCRVTAVDNSPEMLEHVPTEATRVCSDIERLSLGPAFDTVILGSCLINSPYSAHRAALLTACRRNLRGGGVLLFERHDPDWLSSATAGYVASIGDIEIYIDRIDHRSDELAMSIRYRSSDGEWFHHFTAVPLGDEQLTAELIAAKFEHPIWINKRWGKAYKNAV